jgi:manganese/zinc/iron transport system permease protein
MLAEALFLQLGYNATLVTIGAALLGMAAGATGTFLFLRKRALVSDAISHATLPGLCLAFLVLVALGGDGRWLPGLLIGSALSAWVGLLCLSALIRRTRLTEDAAIGAVLSVFFGFGVVLLTVIQSLGTGRAAGLESFLLGSTAGLLRADALLIAIGGGLSVALIWVLRRPMTLVAFDPGYAQTRGYPVHRIDLAIMALVMGVTVIGLKIVGLILIVALLIIPPVTARFWTQRSGAMVALSALFGGMAGYFGAAISATAPDMPTGPIVVLVSFALFSAAFLFAPERGVTAAYLRHARYQRAVHVRQGLLALGQGQPIYERLTLRLLRRDGLVRADGVPTEAGRAQAAKALRDEARWAALRSDPRHEAFAALYDGLREIETILTSDQLAEIDARLGGPKGVVT